MIDKEKWDPVCKRALEDYFVVDLDFDKWFKNYERLFSYIMIELSVDEIESYKRDSGWTLNEIMEGFEEYIDENPNIQLHWVNIILSDVRNLYELKSFDGGLVKNYNDPTHVFILNYMQYKRVRDMMVSRIKTLNS